MVKTTINLEEELYKKLMKESLERYGRARSFSMLINEKLRRAESLKAETKTVGIKKKADIVERTAGMWKTKESGAEYVRRLRKESEERFKRLGI